MDCGICGTSTEVSAHYSHEPLCITCFYVRFLLLASINMRAGSIYNPTVSNNSHVVVTRVNEL